jgi:hypothetical protein
MVLSIGLMVFGFILSLWGMGVNNDNLISIGLITVMVVCVSWWSWVMYVIKTMIRYNEKTAGSISEIKDILQQLRIFLNSDK